MTFLGGRGHCTGSGRKWRKWRGGRWRAPGALPSAFRVPPEPVVPPAKAGARTRRLTVCRGAAKRSPSQDCAQAVHATEALVVSRGRATYALSKVLNSCHMAHAGVAPPGTVPVARCSACQEAGRAAAGTPGSSLRAPTTFYLFYVLDGTVLTTRPNGTLSTRSNRRAASTRSRLTACACVP